MGCATEEIRATESVREREHGGGSVSVGWFGRELKATTRAIPAFFAPAIKR